MEKQTRSRIDPVTGEVLEIETIVIGRAGGVDKDGDFVKVFPALFLSFLRELKIDDGKARLVMLLIYKASKMTANSDNVVFAPNEDLMTELNISRGTLIRYIAELCKLKIIKRVQPRMPAYEINPNMIYKGTLSKFYKNQNSKKFVREKNGEESST